ncbi:hypothetical protein FI667_g15443, partial [Globisporangium splendens]
MNLFAICNAALFAALGVASVEAASCPADKTLEANKALVATALDALFNKHDTSAVDKYFGSTYLQHNPFVPDGTDALKAFVSASGNTSYEIGAVGAEGDLVWSHNRDPTGNASIIVDIFRIKDGKLVEHWDISQTEVPASQTVSGRPMFPIEVSPAPAVKGCSDSSASTPCVTKEELEANKVLVASALDAFFNKRDASAVDKYVGLTYMQHNPTAKDGPDGLKALIGTLTESVKLELGAQIAEGDLVWNHSRYSGIPDTPALIIVDVFRVKDGKLVEHWDVAQTEVTKTASGRPMFPIGA